MTEGEKIISEFTGLKPTDPMWAGMRALAHKIDKVVNDYLVSTVGAPNHCWQTSAELARVKDVAYRRGREIEELKRRLAITEIAEIATRKVGAIEVGEPWPLPQDDEITVTID
jgi:hypothetical protein